VLINHGDFHNFLFIFCVAVVVGWYIWKRTGILFKDAFLCISLGALAHIAEDALANGSLYYFYRPFSERGWYQGYIITPWEDIIWANTVIASTNLIIIGVALVIVAVMIRCKLQGYGWLTKYDLLTPIFVAVQSVEENNLSGAEPAPEQYYTYP